MSTKIEREVFLLVFAIIFIMKTVFITGINRGIGKGIAQRFLKEGYFVVGTSLDSNIDYLNYNLKSFKLDLYDDKSIEDCAKEVLVFGKNIDIYINNAGVLLDIDKISIDVDILRKTLQINLIGAIDLTQKLLPLINNGGHIVNISSSAGSMEDVHHTEYPAYKISKAGLNMFTSWLAFKLKDKIKVSSVHPGRVNTEMAGWAGELSMEEAVGHIFDTAINKDLETGQFWFKGEKFIW